MMTIWGKTSERHDAVWLGAEITRLNKIIKALMDRAERSTRMQSTDFNLFQTAILLEEEVHRRTDDLETALHENERINRDLNKAKERLEREIQDRMAVQNALRMSEERYRVATEAAMDAFFTINDQFVIVFANSTAEKIFGYSIGELNGYKLTMLMPMEYRESSLQSIQNHLHEYKNSNSGHSLQMVCANRDGNLVDIEFSFGGFEHNGRRFYTCIARDITERKQAERKVQALQDALREQAVRDALTGVYNRHYLAETFSRELARVQRAGKALSVIICDIDYFKRINDTYGHLAGDEVLKMFAELLQYHSRGSDIVCRFGGEEFLLALPEMCESDACIRAEQLRRSFETTNVRFGADNIQATVSFGVAVFPQNGTTMDELIGAADKALYDAKTSGRNRVQRFGALIER